MKPHNSLTIAWKSIAVAIALALVVGVAGVQAAPPPDQITAHSQDITSGVITVDSVNSPQDGWIVVYKDSSNLTPNQIVGWAPVHKGANNNVKVTLDTAKVGDAPTLWIVLQADNGTPGVFEWGLRGLPMNDAPIVENGHPIVAAFGTAASMAQPAAAPSAPAAPAPAAPAPAAPAPAATAAPSAPAGTKPAAGASSIVIPDQDLTSGVIKVSSANSPVDGWIVVYRDPNNFTPGQVVGYAPVHKGANSDIKLTIDTAKAGDAPTLWAVLQADNGVPGLFEWGLKGLSLADTPVVENGHDIVTGFGTSAAFAPAPSATTAAPAAPAAPAPAATAAPSAPAATTKPAASTNPIVLRNQDITSGVIKVDSVTSPVPGWIVFYKDPNNLTAAQIVGYAPVQQGVNKDVKVTLDTAKVADAPTLWAVLQADNGIPGVFEWGLRGLPYDDAPVVQNGHNIVAGFGTAAAQ